MKRKPFSGSNWLDTALYKNVPWEHYYISAGYYGLMFEPSFADQIHDETGKKCQKLLCSLIYNWLCNISSLNDGTQSWPMPSFTGTSSNMCLTTGQASRTRSNSPTWRRTPWSDSASSLTSCLRARSSQFYRPKGALSTSRWLRNKWSPTASIWIINDVLTTWYKVESESVTLVCLINV